MFYKLNLHTHKYKMHFCEVNFFIRLFLWGFGVSVWGKWNMYNNGIVYRYFVGFFIQTNISWVSGSDESAWIEESFWSLDLSHGWIKILFCKNLSSIFSLDKRRSLWDYTTIFIKWFKIHKIRHTPDKKKRF